MRETSQAKRTSKLFPTVMVVLALISIAFLEFGRHPLMNWIRDPRNAKPIDFFAAAAQAGFAGVLVYLNIQANRTARLEFENSKQIRHSAIMPMLITEPPAFEDVTYPGIMSVYVYNVGFGVALGFSVNCERKCFAPSGDFVESERRDGIRLPAGGRYQVEFSPKPEDHVFVERYETLVELEYSDFYGQTYRDVKRYANRRPPREGRQWHDTSGHPHAGVNYSDWLLEQN